MSKNVVCFNFIKQTTFWAFNCSKFTFRTNACQLITAVSAANRTDLHRSFTGQRSVYELLYASHCHVPATRLPSTGPHLPIASGQLRTGSVPRMPAARVRSCTCNLAHTLSWVHHVFTTTVLGNRSAHG